MKRKKLVQEKHQQYIIVNEYMQVFAGLKGGYPYFEEDWLKAKSLNNMEQFDKVRRGTLDKLEILHL